MKYDPSQEKQILRLGGLALIKTGNTPVQIRVGDVVCVRQDKAQWSVGLVRWFRIPGQGEMCFGVQLLAPEAWAVQTGVRAGL